MKKINLRFLLFWPDIFLLSPVICQRVTCNILKFNRLKIKKNKFPVISGISGQNVRIEVFDSDQIPLPSRRSRDRLFGKGESLFSTLCLVTKKTAFLTILNYYPNFTYAKSITSPFVLLLQCRNWRLDSFYENII